MRTFIHHGWDVTLGCNFHNGSHFAPGGGGKEDQWGVATTLLHIIVPIVRPFFSLSKNEAEYFDCKFSWGWCEKYTKWSTWT